MRPRIKSIPCLAMLLAPAVGLAAAKCEQPWSCDGVARIVAIGDVHGALAEYQSILRATGLLDDAGHWAGGASFLVSTGDLVDRGPDSTGVISATLSTVDGGGTMDWPGGALQYADLVIPANWPVWDSLDYGFTHPTTAYHQRRWLLLRRRGAFPRRAAPAG